MSLVHSLPQKRLLLRRTYQLDSSSTKLWMARAGSVILYSARPSSTSLTRVFSLDSAQRSIRV